MSEKQLVVFRTGPYKDCMLYDRARIIILDHGFPFSRKTVKEAQERYDPMFTPFGGKYSGYISHCYRVGPNPAHFYLIDHPTETVLADLLIYAERLKAEGQIELVVIREMKGSNAFRLTIDNIVSDIASVVRSDALRDIEVPSTQLARCWSGTKIIENMARKAGQ